MHMCVPSTLAKTYSHFFFLPIVADEILLFILVLVKALTNMRKYGTGRNANRFTLILLKDSAMCFTMYVRSISSRIISPYCSELE